jgi:hypothetical protein
MKLRMKLPVILFYLFFGIVLIIALTDELSKRFLDPYLWLIVLCALFLVPGFIFIFPTFRVVLNTDCISVTWQLGYGKLSFYKYHKFTKWNEVRVVFSLLPIWLPFHIINVNGLWMGSFLTHKKAALLYIADHVPPEVMDDEVRLLVQKYRKKKKR